MPDNRRKPALRFAGFTDAWKQHQLGEIVKQITRSDPESDAPVMMITANNGFIEQSERYAFNNAGESLKKYILLKKGELAYNHGASKLRPYGSCFVLITAENARIPFVYHCFSADGYNPEFLSIELNGKDVENQLRQIVSSGARMDGLLNISFDEYTSVSILLPELTEQNRIADLFRHLDHLITLHQCKYTKIANIKKVMLEKMFPKNGASVPEIRFAGFTDAWEQRKLGDMITVHPFKPYLAEPALDGEVEVIQQGNVPILGYANGKGFTDYQKITLFGDHTVSIYKAKHPFFVASDGLKILSSQIVDGDFFYYLLERYKPIPEGYKRHFTILQEQVCFYPQNSAEQNRIANVLSSLDNLITLHQRELERLQNIKKACLEKMFV